MSQSNQHFVNLRSELCKSCCAGRSHQSRNHTGDGDGDGDGSHMEKRLETADSPPSPSSPPTHKQTQTHCQGEMLEMNSCWVVLAVTKLNVERICSTHLKGFPMSTASVIYAEIDIEMCMIMSIKFVWIFSRRFTRCPRLSLRGHTHAITKCVCVCVWTTNYLVFM